MLKTLFLQAPSFEGFDGGAGSRYQAKREVRSFWYPTWLAQPAALVPHSRLLDAPCQEVTTGVDLGQVSGPGRIWVIVREILMSPQMMRRRLRAGVEFFRCLHAREA